MKYVYAYALGPDPKTDWLLRYDDYAPYRPTKYPTAHVHFNGVSDAYSKFSNPGGKALRDVHCPTDRITIEDFIEHLILEYDAPTRDGKAAALRFLGQSRKRFHEQDRTRWPTYDQPE
jgi:hypothetical protein